jgi:replicative DNA helicase
VGRLGGELEQLVVGDPRDALVAVLAVVAAGRAVCERVRVGLSRGPCELAAALEHELERLEAVSRHDGSLTGLATGFIDFDKITGGLQPGNLVVVGAAPSMGKSSWVTNIATHVAGHQHRPVLLFGLEMSEGEIAQRVLAAETPLPGEKMLRGRIAQHDWPKLLATANRLAGAPLYLHDASDVTLTQIRARARQLALHQNPTAASRS